MLHQPRKSFSRRRRILRSSTAVLLQRRNLSAVEVDVQRNVSSAAEDTAVYVSVIKATSKFCVEATSAAKALQSSKKNFKSFDGSATSAAKVAPRRSRFFKGFDSNLTSAAYFNFFLVFTNARKPKSSLIFLSRGYILKSLQNHSDIEQFVSRDLEGFSRFEKKFSFSLKKWSYYGIKKGPSQELSKLSS